MNSVAFTSRRRLRIVRVRGETPSRQAAGISSARAPVRSRQAASGGPRAADGGLKTPASSTCLAARWSRAADPITLTGKSVGAHAALINANDVAVMGARPRWFLAVVLLPPGTETSDVRELFTVMYEALDGMGVTLVGGHTEITNAVTQPLVVGQMMGLREDGGYVRTGGLSAGDAVVQVGPAPVEGAAILAAEPAAPLTQIPDDSLRAAERAIENPGISVVNQALRAAELGALALHDPTEGGLSAGLHELAEASGVGLVVAEAEVAVVRTRPPDLPGVRPRSLGCPRLGYPTRGLLAGHRRDRLRATQRGRIRGDDDRQGGSRRRRSADKWRRVDSLRTG